ncbi:MAG: protein kinase domain-containing protein [Planctomycetota bacterium]
MYDVGQEGGTVYIVMQFIEGESLGAILRRRRILPIPEAVQLTIQAARGLGAAHDANLVHQDVKPENIMVPRRGSEAKVADFGLAADVRKGMGSDEVVGTPAYISPEQVTRLPIGGHTDIYSLGATLYHLVTGTPVFELSEIRGLLLAHANDPHEPAHLRNPAIPESLSAIIDQMLEKEAARRPASMAQVVELLTPFLSDKRETAVAAGGGTDFSLPLRLLAGAALAAAAALPFLVPVPAADLATWGAALDAADPARSAERDARLTATKYPGSAQAVRAWLGLAERYPGGTIAAAALERAAAEQAAYLTTARDRARDYDLAGRDVEAALLLAGVARLLPDTPTAEAAWTEAEVYRRKASAGDRILVLGGTYEFDGAPVPIPDMLVDRTEVTAGAYLAWSTATKQTAPNTVVSAPPDHPAAGVTRDEAAAFAAGQRARLPSEAEWEWIARSASSGDFPWGSEFDASRAVHRDGEAAAARPAGSLPDGASRWGALDCAGNVHEWVAPSGLSGVGEGVVKGGGFDSPPRMLRRTARMRVPSGARFPSVGFRTVLDVRGPE